LGKIIFCIFSSSFKFSSVKHLDRPILLPDESTLAICWPSSCTSGQDLYRFKTCFSFSAIHTFLHFYWFIMLCVFLVDFSRDFGILWTSLLIPWSSLSSVILLSFCAFRILEYLLIGIFSWDIVHENPSLSVCWVDLDIFMPYK